jgi:hypothetical protein
MITTEQKREKLLQLAKRRQKDRLLPHRCLADFHNGYYECFHVSPWTVSACNVDADLMLIGQDWASSKLLEREPPVEEWSGGPIFDREGIYVHGVISKGWEGEKGPENFSFGSMLRPSMNLPISRMNGASLDDLQKRHSEGIAVLHGAGL